MSEEEKGWFESITGYKNAADIFDGGGPLKGGPAYEGGGVISTAANAITGSTSSDTTEDTPTGSSEISTVPAVQSEVNKVLAAMNTGSDSVIADVDGSGNRTGTFQVYDSAGNLRTDVTDKEIKYYLDNPDTSISEEDYTKGTKTAKIISLFSKTLGIGYAGILKLQQQGYIPAGGTYPEGTPEFGDNDRDTKLNAILDNGELSEEDKKAQVNALITAGLTDYAASNASQLGLDQVKPLVESIFSDTSTTDPLVAAKSMADGAMISDSYTGVDPNATGTNLQRR